MTRVTVVTGAARGIGRGIAKRLLEAGECVAALDVNAEHLGQLEASADRERLLAVPCDIASEEQVTRAFERVLEWKRRIDGLVNNAAIAQATNAPLPELEFAQWRRILSVNLDGALLCSRAALPALRSARGSIVNIASTRALQSEPHSEAYAASKGGLIALTHALALSLGPEVRVNAISPGWIDTSDAHPDEPPTKLRRTDHEQHPVGRVGRSGDIAEMTAYLLSERATFITGQNFIIDGGMTRKMIYVE